MRIIGLDVGEKRIGVAQVDSNTRIAIPVGYLMVDGTEWQEIARLLSLYGTNWVVLGLPRSNEGNETRQSLYVRNFARTLMKEIPEAKIRFQDESLTSVEAERRLKAKKQPFDKGAIDAEAASIILQDFVENMRNGQMPAPVNTNAMTASLAELLEAKPPQKKRESTAKDTARNASVSPRNAPKHPSKDQASSHPNQDPDVPLDPPKKSKKAFAWLIVPPIIIILAIVVIAVALKVRDDRIRERAEYYAEKEAAMQPEVFNFTIRPGETIMDIQANLEALGYDKTEIEAAFHENYDFPFLSGRPEGATLEGYLPGETFEFYQTATVSDILTKYLEYMGQIIAENDLENAYRDQGLSLYEGITLASIVQKEAGSSDFPTVAQVFLSRLASGWPLGSDVTVSYALDLIDPDRETYTDNEVALSVDSCYNTRQNTGLPCGPISSPSLAALLAVAHPADTSYFYFLTGDDGLMYYSNTESEHNWNAAVHCQTLCQVSL